MSKVACMCSKGHALRAWTRCCPFGSYWVTAIESGTWLGRQQARPALHKGISMLPCNKTLPGRLCILLLQTRVRAAGDALASCSGDRTVRIWTRLQGANSWTCSAILEGLHHRTVRTCCWSPGGRYLATASFDATVGIWESQVRLANSQKNRTTATSLSGCKKTTVVSSSMCPAGQQLGAYSCAGRTRERSKRRGMEPLRHQAGNLRSRQNSLGLGCASRQRIRSYGCQVWPLSGSLLQAQVSSRFYAWLHQVV